MLIDFPVRLITREMFDRRHTLIGGSRAVASELQTADKRCGELTLNLSCSRDKQVLFVGSLLKSLGPDRMKNTVKSEMRAFLVQFQVHQLANHRCFFDSY